VTAGTRGAFVNSKTTAGGGLYLFDNVVPGTYDVVIEQSTLPAGYTLTSPVSGFFRHVCLGGETDLTLDFGVCRKTCKFGDKVFDNSPGCDGVQLGTETGADPARRSPDPVTAGTRGALVDSKTTAGGGLYLFENVVP